MFKHRVNGTSRDSDSSPLSCNYLRRLLSVLCTHSHHKHVLLGRNTCGFGPSYRRKKSCAVCSTRPGVYSESNIHTTFTERVEIRAERSGIIIKNRKKNVTLIGQTITPHERVYAILRFF